jgi:hypothetical protein
MKNSPISGTFFLSSSLAIVNRPAGGIHQADQIFAAAGLDDNASREEVLRVEPADVLDANETVVVDVLDVKSISSM